MSRADPPNVARTQPKTRLPNGLPQAAGRTPAHRRATAPVLDMTFRADDLTRLRSATAAYAVELGAGARTEDVVLIAHELATNAVKHGGGSGRLRLWRDDFRLLCRVSDTGPGLADADAAGAELPSVLMPGGRGLWIARCLAALRIDTGPHGTVITAAVPLR